MPTAEVEKGGEVLQHECGELGSRLNNTTSMIVICRLPPVCKENRSDEYMTKGMVSEGSFCDH